MAGLNHINDLNAQMLEGIAQAYGSSFYLLNSEQFRQNYMELTDAFRSIYPRFNIAYSYKTNYIPKWKWKSRCAAACSRNVSSGTAR